MLYVNHILIKLGKKYYNRYTNEQTKINKTVTLGRKWSEQLDWGHIQTIGAKLQSQNSTPRRTIGTLVTLTSSLSMKFWTAATPKCFLFENWMKANTHSRPSTSRGSCDARGPSFTFLTRSTSFSFSTGLTILSLHSEMTTTRERMSFPIHLAYHTLSSENRILQVARCWNKIGNEGSLKTGQNKVNRNASMIQANYQENVKACVICPKGVSLSEDCALKMSTRKFTGER